MRHSPAAPFRTTPLDAGGRRPILAGRRRRRVGRAIRPASLRRKLLGALALGLRTRAGHAGGLGAWPGLTALPGLDRFLDRLLDGFRRADDALAVFVDQLFAALLQLGRALARLVGGFSGLGA